MHIHLTVSQLENCVTTVTNTIVSLGGLTNTIVRGGGDLLSTNEIVAFSAHI